jgi:hypothetical protein
MTWRAPDVMRIVFVVLVCGLVMAGLTTKARPRGAHQWALVWGLLVLLMWALLGFGWLRST